ncbi:YheT family hydrolase [Okeania sp. SIO2B3]|uniref:YheT family hydrolase n=1 Tax=Okeania sp. SIO2B3 TaxID=2607784 RepID=UPI0013C106DC|nr:alpha/beta fold hydrolase [Okeania sp. SIO2B3]NET40772.1 alpha/beta fold hydrolase [Okeania sp. SIO2B3]
MGYPSYTPPWFLKNGLAMTLYAAFWTPRFWEETTTFPKPSYQEKIFIGANDVPIFGWMAIPENPKGTIIGTYGITGELDNQWFLKLLGRKAYAQGYAVILFDWRAHGKTALLSETLTSDGIYEGQDFVHIAAQAKAMGCPPNFWFTAYSLGGQLALWGAKVADSLAPELGLAETDIGGCAVICPSLEAQRSLSYLDSSPLGRYLDKGITKNLKKLVWLIHEHHPDFIDPEAIERADSIWKFDEEFVIEKLGFSSVEAYYQATSPLYFLPHLKKRTLIIYAEDDPMFDPTIAADLKAACDSNSAIDLMLTRYGGHVAHVSSNSCQAHAQDPDVWWALNRIFEWIKQNETSTLTTSVTA